MVASMMLGDGNCLVETTDKQLLLTGDEAVGLASSLVYELARADVAMFVVLHRTMLGYVKMHGPPQIEGLACECKSPATNPTACSGTVALPTAMSR